MQFAQPFWLILGALACALTLWQFRRFDQRQHAALARFAAARLLPRLTGSVSPSRRRLKRALFVAGVALLFIALARPQAGFTWQEAHRRGLELLFAVDTSKSMLAQDVKPDRLARTKLAIEDLLAKLQGDGLGLVAFAGDAFLQCPVTLDYEAFRQSVEALDVNVIPRVGTDIAAAIREAQAVFKTRTASEKILILLTDGEDLGGEALTAATAAAKEGVKIFAVGVGTAAGELVPADAAASAFARDDNGQPVRSRLDETMLRKIAEATGGVYAALDARGAGLDAIYQQGLAPFARHDLSSRQSKVPIERFAWPLGAALLCFAAELFVGTRRRTRATKAPAPCAASRRPAAATAAALFVASVSAHAASPVAAEQAYGKGDFASAQREFAAGAAANPNDPRLRFNAGAAAYKAGDLGGAKDAFQSSLKSDDLTLQQSSYYNLGNTLYRTGQKSETASPQETIKQWTDAVKAYDAALQITPADAQARQNRDLVQSRLDALKKREEEKKKQQQQQQQQKQQQNNQKDQQQQSGGGSSDQQKQQDQGKQGQGSDSQKQEGKDQQKQGKSGKGDQQHDQPSADKEQAGQKPSEPEQNGKNGSDPKQEQDAKSDAKKPDAGKDTKDPAASDKTAGKDTKDAQPKPAKSQGEQASKTDGEDGKGKDAPAPTKPLNAGAKAEQGKAESAAANSPAPEAASTEVEPRVAGAMSREEARQLLDSLKGDLREAPALSERGRSASSSDRKKLHDW
jgi:Ca-activated chloride channel family protein